MTLLLRALQGHKLTMTAATFVSGDSRSFFLFQYLHEDLKHTVLSFVADAPLEAMPQNYPTSFLTHGLPPVSHAFRSFSKSDIYWKTAISRQTAREPLLWRRALARICHKQQCKRASVVFERRYHNVDNANEADGALIERTHQFLGKPTYKSIYQNVVTHHLRFKGPVFLQGGNLQLGHPFELQLTSGAHVGLLQNVLREHPVEARQGGPIDRDAFFIHANRGPLKVGTPAVLVQILRCDIVRDEQQQRADVILLPFAHVWLEKMWFAKARDGGDSVDGDTLLYGQCLKMPKGVSADMNRLARNEALAGVMDRLAGDLFEAFDNEEEDVSSSSDDDDDSDDYTSEEDDDDSSSYLEYSDEENHIAAE